VNVIQLTRSLVLLMGFTLLTACGGGGGGGSSAASQGSNADSGCTGSCATDAATRANLTVADVQQVIAQAVLEANTRGVDITLAITDRVGNVLAIFRTNNFANPSETFTIQSGFIDGDFGLENVTLNLSSLAAISKAVTGSYLASEGNAFTTRTASQIVQEHFNPHEIGQPGGPLFGVQFSQLPCSDMVQQGSDLGVGPRRAPLGLSADPGGMPLYKNGHPVGGIGVMADGIYGLDRDLQDTDSNLDEIIAVAGSFGFAPPDDRRADRITADGRTFRFADATESTLLSNPATADFATQGALGSLIDDESVATPNQQNYFVATNGIRAGTTFGLADSGIVSSDSVDNTLYPGLDAFVLVDDMGALRFAPQDGVVSPGGENLTAAEVTLLVRSALAVANRARAQIRRPLDSQARVSISVVDTDGNILAIARTRDAPMFGTDVSLQKARTATFFSSDAAEDTLETAGTVTALNDNAVTTYTSTISRYVDAGRTFFGVGVGDLTGDFAFADRSGGNLSRPFYPDGTLAFNGGNRVANHGPFSRSFINDSTVDEWSPFSVGLQLDLVLDNIVTHLAGGNPTSCTEFTGGRNQVPNGIQIFPGSVPIYKNGVLVGGIGVSGDGVDQDDMISFLGVHEASLAAFAATTGGAIDGQGNIGAGFGNAPIAIRADQILPFDATTNPAPDPNFDVRLRYVQCPQNPYIGSAENNVCQGL